MIALYMFSLENIMVILFLYNETFKNSSKLKLDLHLSLVICIIVLFFKIYLAIVVLPVPGLP